MPLEGDYEPSPWEPIAQQVELFESTGGSEGNELEGQPCIILWTRGCKTGKIRKAPLMRVTDGQSYAVLASMGGAPSHPVWYGNLVADPHVSLQDGAEVRDFVARIAEGDEKATWWQRAIEVWPPYDEYQARTERVIPLVILDPA